jgi:hypothetical protein
MLPGISADACMIADLGFDPATNGLQSFEATQLLDHEKSIDVATPLILWQIGVVGDTTYSAGRYSKPAFDRIFEKFVALYGRDHRFCIYEASEFSAVKPLIHWTTFADVKPEDIRVLSDLGAVCRERRWQGEGFAETAQRQFVVARRPGFQPDRAAIADPG